MIGISLGILLIVVHWTMVLVERKGKNLYRVRVANWSINGPYKFKTSYHKTWEQAINRASGWSEQTSVKIEYKSLLTGEWV